MPGVISNGFEEVPKETSEIQEFYNGKTIFVTGATGFLGKLLLEKILRTCDPKKIYILLREKKGKQPEERFKELFDIPAFDGLRQLKPQYQEKIAIIEGDLLQPKLGIKPKDKDLLLEEVNCVFHSGATVRFDEELQKAAYINVRSTRDLLNMAKEMKNLESYVHVSTAYSNCVHKTIEEKFYEPVLTGENLLKLVECLDTDIINEITPMLLKGNPNTYVFTKAIAEEVVKHYMKDLPLAVLRPSIVISSFKEPIPGWLDNLYGPTSILMGAAFGLLRALNCDEKSPADIVPVDFVINSLLAAAWDVAKTRKGTQKDEEAFTDNKIYNYVSAPQNLITWERYESLTRKYALQVPSPLIVWHSTFFLIKSRLLWLIYTFFVQTIPAHIIDLLARCFGKEPMLVKAYKKIDKFCNAICFFTTNSWKFNNDNLMSLWYKLNDKDKEMYPFDISQMDWEDYFKTYIVGARVYLMKDPLDTLPQGRRKLLILKIAHYTLLSIFAFLLYKLSMFVYSLF